MFYSKKYKIVIIGIPKNGSRAISKAMLSYDPDGEHHSISTEDKVYVGNDFPQGIVGHARAVEIRDTLGSEYYNSLSSIAFIRHPFAKLVSAYFFNRNGSLLALLGMKGEKKILSRKLRSFLTTLIAKILPFKIWCFIYPYRSNLEYVVDENGDRIVNHIGRVEFLEEDLVSILRKLNMPTDDLKLDRVNASKHKKYEVYFRSAWFRKMIEKRVADDLAFYENICLEFNNGSSY